MRILILASGDLWAGAEAVVYQLVDGLLEFPGVHLTAAFLNKGRLSEEVRALGVDVHILDEAKHSFPQLLKSMRQLVGKLRPDIIHSHRYKENILAWGASRGKGGVKLIATQHGMPEKFGHQTYKAKIKTFMSFRLLSNSFDRTVAVSEEMQNGLISDYGFNVGSISIIHNGIAMPSSRTFKTDKPVLIGSAGRMFPVKDFELLVEIASRVIPATSDVNFIIAGNGPQFDLLQEKIRLSGLDDRFQLPGHVHDMDAFYQGLDIYINTSVYEGIPMSVLEAMSHGLPIVAPYVGGFPEIVEDGKSGYLINTRQPAAFAERCIELAADMEKRKQMAEAAKQRVRDHFSKEAMAAGYYRLCQDVLS